MGRVDRQIGRQFHNRNGVARSLFAPIDANGTCVFRDDYFLAGDSNTTSFSTTTGMAFEILEGFRIGFYFVLVDDDNSVEEMANGNDVIVSFKTMLLP